jgi:phage shock protein A
MSIFRRLLKIGQAVSHNAIDRMESPELMLDQAIRDKENQVREAKRAVQGCIATERQTKAQLERERGEKAEWEARAEAALRAGKDELAVRALNRATEHEQKAAALEQGWQTQRDRLDGLKNDIRKLEEQLAEYKRNKDFILAQSKAAEVKKSIYEARAKISKHGDVDNLMERLRAKAERATYEAEAAEEMADLGADTLERDLDALPAAGGSPDVQAKLAALRAKLGQPQT